MQTKENIIKILQKCNIEVFGVIFIPRVLEKGDGFLIQLRANIEDNKTKKISLQSGAKYYVSSHAIDDEVVYSLWKAMQDFVIHESREGFKYQGKAIFGPHYPVRTLHIMASIAQEAKRD